MKNYYLILGVERDSTQDQIKAAYRQQAKDLHPDYYGQDSVPFKNLQEAYAVLSDPERRRSYDRVSAPRPGTANLRDRRGPEPLIRPQVQPELLIPDTPVDLGDLSLRNSFHAFRPSFDELFDRIWQNFSLQRPKVEEIRPLTVEIRVTRREAFRGGRVTLLVPAQLRCPDCRGRGCIGLFSCWRCNGDRVITGEYPVEISFPPGVTDNHVVQIPLNRLGINNVYLNVVFRVSG